MKEENWKTFNPVAPPEEWRDDIIDAAIAARQTRKPILLSVWNGVAVSALAACWVAIAFFYLATPKTAPGSTDHHAIQLSSGQLNTFSLLSQRLNLNPDFYE